MHVAEPVAIAEGPPLLPGAAAVVEALAARPNVHFPPGAEALAQASFVITGLAELGPLSRSW